jgi:hypothetical protein
MNNKEPVPEYIMNDINKKFGFLFERGYTIHSACTINDPYERYPGWEVIVIRQDFRIKFVELTGFGIMFGSPSKGFKNIRSLIYFLSDEKEFIEHKLLDLLTSGRKKEAKLLHKYIDKFEALYGSDFPLYEKDLDAADKKFLERIDQSFSLPVAASTQAPKKNPIAAVIILFPVFLIGYAFIIGMIASTLTDRLDFEIVPAIIWVASLLLAAGTVYLFNK